MGTVYEAVQENLGRRVAVKLLDERLSYDRQQLERFRREAEVVAALGHPNIVQVTDFQYPEELGKQPFLVMELLRGESLAGRIDHAGAMAGDRVAFIIAQVLSALGAAHRAGVVHRDIKPDNIFLLADAAIPDTVKVLDFGIAKLSDGSSIGPAQQKLTSTNAMLGTPAFMAPEQARGADDVDARADVYAVGATMYQALTGKMPFEAASVPALLFAIVEKTPPPLRELRPDLPADIVAVVERAMAKRREDRFQDAESMRAALAPWSGLPASSPAPGASPGTSKPLTPIETAPTAVGAVAIAHAPTVASTPPPPREPASELARAASGGPVTPMVSAYPPTPVVPYAPRPPHDAGAWKRRNRTMVILAVLAMFGIYKLAEKIIDRDPERGRHARGDDSAAVEFGQSVARSATSMGLNVAAQALGVAPSASAVPSASTIVNAPSASIAKVTSAASATAKGPHRYSGNGGHFSGSNYSCNGCDWQEFNEAMRAKQSAIGHCFEAAQHDPPLHEYVVYDVGVANDGTLTTFSQTSTPIPHLDQCMERVIKSTPMHMKSPEGGSTKLDFTAECKPGSTTLWSWCPD